MRLLIEHQCPQCGAPATLEETERLFTCGFCRVRSYLLEVGRFRYCFSSAAPANRDLFFVPYWRFKGLLFASTGSGIQQRFIDVSQLALAEPHLPVSVGLRSQALKLRFLRPDQSGYFLTPAIAPSAVLKGLEARFTPSLPTPVWHLAYVGESLSLIWSPFYVNAGRRLQDAVLDKPVGGLLPETFNPLTIAGGAADSRLQFVSTLCPACGWDLEGSRDSLVLNCRNCQTCWHPTRDGLAPLRYAHLSLAGQRGIFLPFWRIKATVTGVRLESYADLVRVANLPRVVQPGWESITFYFWVMAFKVQPQGFLRLARVMTLSQPRAELVEALPAEELFPVTLPVEEAFAASKILLASFITPVEDLAELLPRISVKPESYLLTYVPFELRPHEYVQPQYHLAINRNMIALSKHL